MHAIENYLSFSPSLEAINSYLSEDNIDKTSNAFTGWFKKKVVPTKEISGGIPATLSAPVNNPPIMHLLIMYMLKELKPFLIEIPTRSHDE